MVAAPSPGPRTNRRKPVAVGVAVSVILFVAGLAFGHYYLGWFTKDPLRDGPVIVNPQPPSPTSPASVAYTVEPVVEGLVVPWSLVFPSSNRWLVSERGGTVRVVQDGQLQHEPLLAFPEVSSREEEGLMGLALDPAYAKNKYVYACYAAPDQNGLANKVVRFTDSGQEAEVVAGSIQTLISGIPSAQNHAGCRLGFGPDGKLYITTGDASRRDIAQDRSSLGGKILRINADGSIPKDNPFSNSAIWSLGHRNPQGIAWQPKTNQLYSTEHGPSIWDGPAGGDEVNRIQKGKNYGWPEVSHDQTDPRFVSPLIVFTPAVAPGGMAFYTADKLPQFTGNLFFAGLRGQGLYRVIFASDDPNKVASYQKMADINVGRLRDVVQGPDGNLYFMTSNRDGRGAPRDGDDKIYRIRPE